MDNLHIPITGDNKGFVNALNEAKDKVRSTAKDIEQSGMSIEQMFNRIKLAAAGAFMGLSVKGLISDIIRVRGEFQRADTAIQTMLGSKEKADELLSKVREYAKISPLEFGDITRATQMMIGFNIEADKVPGFIKAIGDVSMGESGKFNSLTLAFSQMSATGKLMGQDLNQMINAGFNPLSVMAEKTGKSMAELKEQMSKGAITAQMVQQAFIDATSEGGKFFNMSEEAAKTIGDQISMLNDAMDNMYNELGKKGEKVIVESIGVLTKLIDNYEIIGKILMELVAIYGSYKAALIVNIALEKTQAFNRLAHVKGLTAMQLATSILTTKTKALNAVLAKNPYVLVATAVMSVVSALVIFRKKTDEAAAKAEELQEELKNQDQELGENRACLQRLQTEWNKLTSDKEKKRWITENKDEFQKLGIEINTVQEAENAFVNNSATIIKAMELRAKAAAHAALATRRYQEALENREAGYDRRKNPSTSDKIKGILDVGWDFDFSGSIARQANISANQMHNAATKAEREAQEHLDKQKELEQEASELMNAAKIRTSTNAANDKKTGGKTGKTTNPAEDAAKERQRVYERDRAEAKEKARVEKETSDLLMKLSIANTENAEEKKRKEEDYQHQLDLQQIEKEAEEMKEAILEAKRKEWEAQNKDKTKVWADTEQAKAGTSNITLSSGQQFYIDTKKAIKDSEYSAILEQRRKRDEEAMREYLKEYGNYQERRLAITQEYEEKINDTKIEGERKALERQKESELEALDERYGLVTQAMADLFADASKKSVKAIQDIIYKYEALVKYLEGHKGSASKDELSALGLSDKDIDMVLKGEISIKELTDRLKEMKGELAERSPYKSFETNMKNAIELFKKAENAAGLGKALSYTASQIQAFLPSVKEFGQEISNIFGVDDSKITAAIDGLDGLMTASGGIGQIMQGDIGGGIMNTVKGISQMVDALDGAFGADYSGYERMVDQYDRLISVWDDLIDRKKEYISLSYGMEADKAGKEAIELANKEIEAYKELGKARLNAGSSAGSHSIGVRIKKSTSGSDWENIAAALGLSVNEVKNKLGGRLTGLFDLSASELKDIQEHAFAWWSTLDEDVQKYLQGIIDGEKQIQDLEKQTTEQILQTSVDDVFDDFMSALYDLADDSEEVFDDVAENWEKMMNKMVLNNLVGAKYKQELEKWYKQWNEAYRGDGTIDKEEINALRTSYNDLIHQAADEVKTLKEQGIVTSPSSASVYKQDASSGGWQSMGQETADELNGRFTALQISGEKISEGVTTMLTTLSSLSSLADDRNITLVEIRNLMITNNAFLEDILTVSKKMYNDFGQKLDKININTK